MAQLRNQVLLKKIARHIKMYRDDQDVTHGQFFIDTGTHLGRIETAKTNISIGTLEAICKYFRVSLEDFFKGI